MRRSIEESLFSLILTCYPLEVGTFDFSTTVLLNLSANVSPRIMHSCLRARLPLMRAKAEARATTAQKRYECNYDKHVRKTPVFNEKQLVSFGSPSISVKEIDLKTTDRPTFYKLMAGADGTFPIIGVQ